MTLKERRKMLGLNQTETAERLGLQQSYYSRVERGRENPTIGVFERLADLYQAEVDEVVREWLDARATIRPDSDIPGWRSLHAAITASSRLLSFPAVTRPRTVALA